MSLLERILKKESKGFLGVDLGGGGIKMVELGLKDKKPKLLTYGYTEKYLKESERDFLDDPAMPDILAKVCQKAKVVAKDATASLPLHKVSVSVIAVAAANEAELKLALDTEAAKLIDYPTSEAVIDYKIIKEESKDPSVKSVKSATKKILLTVTRRDLIKKYVDAFKKAGLNLKVLETESFALARSLVGKDKSSVAIIDIGASRTNVVIVDSLTPVFSRSLALGGMDLTKTLAEMLGMDAKTAEEAKKDISNLPGFSAAAGDLPKRIADLLSPVTSEAKYLFDLFSKDEKRSIEKIILTGGSSYFPGLCEFFSKELGVKTFIGDPWARVLYHEGLKSVLQDIGPRFSVAIGLAMREIE